MINRKQIRGVAQPGSAPALGAGSRRFKSSRPDQISKSFHIKNLPLVTLYVFKGKTGKRYVGITNNLPRRLREHRSGKTKGNQLLDEFIILHEEKFPDYRSARKREKFLKSGQGRKWLDELELKPEPAGGG
jgi:putative endonuclease